MVSVLRLGHRPERDERMTTHVGLTARAFGADTFYIPEMDTGIKETLEDVSQRFGGDLCASEVEDWKRLVTEWNGDVIHLTMYGQDINEFFEEMGDEIKEPLIIVGAEKVPREVYERADHNVSVGNQPHSEVAALAVFLDRLNEREIPPFPDGKMKIVPRKEGKSVIDRSEIPDLDKCLEFMFERDMDEGLMKHTFSVLDRTVELYLEHGGDLELLMAGALLHDIGRTVTHEVEHGIEGSRLIREKGWSKDLARMVERHIGGGITKKEAAEQGLPERDMVPETLEEKIICHADNTAGGEERLRDMIERTKEAGYKESAERMKKLADEFEENICYKNNQ